MMLKSIALACVLAAGCKADSPSTQPSETPAAAPTEQDGVKPRSGKIDLNNKRHPSSGSVEGSDPQNMSERRKARVAELDTDHDGEVSEAERKAARAQRAAELHARLDKNSDGKLTPDELSGSQFRRLDPDSIDANKDGDVTVDELAQALETRSRQWGAGRRRDRNRGPDTSTGSAGSAVAPQ